MSIGIDPKEYIDVDDALRRVGGNMNLYRRLLGRFADSDQYAPLEEALRNGNTAEAGRLAHTLKGVSANLSLVKVKDLSADLDLLIKNGADHAAVLDELKLAYGVTLQVIAEILN